MTILRDNVGRIVSPDRFSINIRGNSLSLVSAPVSRVTRSLITSNGETEIDRKWAWEREREKEGELAESGISFESVRSGSRSSRYYQVEKRWEMVKLVYQLTRDPQVGLSKINGSISFRVPRAGRYNFSRVNTCSSPRGIIHWTKKGKKKHLIIISSSN